MRDRSAWFEPTWRVRVLSSLILVAVLVTPGRAQRSTDDQISILTRGPVHEALAEQFDRRLVESLLVPNQPPRALRELPPEFRPTDQQTVWIPGYWAWDDDSQEFLWVSGMWRRPPPERRWVPGHWTPDESGYRWVSGFWAPRDARQLRLLDPPPAPRGEPFGDVAQRPSPDHFWIPGRWVMTNGDYAWKNGFWSRGHDNWVWTADRYVWTPSGVIYRPGYWDYRLPARGTLFAPVRFTNRIYDQPEFQYSPSHAIDLSVLPAQLFVRPNYSHYYFGDYFDPRFADRQIYPWIRLQDEYGFYDPLYTYYHSRAASESNFLDRVGQWFDYYRANERLRPPHTLSEQRSFADRFANSPQLLANAVVTSGLQELVGRSGNLFQPLSQSARLSTLQSVQPLLRFSERIASGELNATAQNQGLLELPELSAERIEMLKPVTPDTSDASQNPTESATGVTTEDQAGLPATDQPGQQPPAQPGQPVPEQPGAQTPAQPGEQPTAQPSEQTPAQPGEQPTQQPGEQADEQADEQAPTQPGEQPSEQPSEQPGEQDDDPQETQQAQASATDQDTGQAGGSTQPESNASPAAPTVSPQPAAPVPSPQSPPAVETGTTSSPQPADTSPPAETGGEPTTN